MSSKTPIDEYLGSKEAAQTDRKQHEIALWQHWRSNGQKPEHLEPLLKLYEPVIAQKVRMWKAPTVPESAFKAELNTHLIKALETFDPTRGVALNTHVEARLPKAMRYNNRFANLAYIPEAQAGKIGAINKAKDTLREELGRDPTTEELADHLSMPPKRLETILKSVRRDVPAGRSGGPESYDYSGGSAATAHGFEDQQIAVAQNILPEIFPNKPEMVELFHHTFGTGGREQILATNTLAKKLNKTPAQISRMKTQMGATLKKHLGMNE